MTTQLKLRRGTTAQTSTFTGAQGEVTIDTTKNTIVVHDGATAGGFPMLKETGTAASAVKIENSGGWSITPTGTKLFFNYNGTNVGSLDSSGNLIVSGNITAYGTV